MLDVTSLIAVVSLVFMLNYLVYLFLKGRKTKKRDIKVELPPGMDPNFARTIEECFKTGKPIRGYYDDNGEYHTEVIDLGEDK